MHERTPHLRHQVCQLLITVQLIGKWIFATLLNIPHPLNIIHDKWHLLKLISSKRVRDFIWNIVKALTVTRWVTRSPDLCYEFRRRVHECISDNQTGTIKCNPRLPGVAAGQLLKVAWMTMAGISEHMIGSISRTVESAVANLTDSMYARKSASALTLSDVNEAPWTKLQLMRVGTLVNWPLQSWVVGGRTMKSRWLQHIGSRWCKSMQGCCNKGIFTSLLMTEEFETLSGWQGLER